MKPLVDFIFKNKNPDKLEIIDFLDSIFSTKIQDYVDDSYKELAEYLNAYAHRLHMKREKITDRAVFISKKRYIANVWDNEGVRYSEPELAMTGVEAIRSSTPAFCRDKIKQAIRLIMSSDENEMIDFIAKTREEFFKLTPEEVSFPKSINEVTKFMSNLTMYQKGTPIHVRGAILYNHYIKDKKLQRKYSIIKNGEKIKYCYLKLPNPIHENVISYIQKLPPEFELEKYIDYNMQFEKTFLNPLKLILDIIGWKIEKQNTLDSFFF
jgi:DNA polymerase elongation subunit (family B)